MSSVRFDSFEYIHVQFYGRDFDARLTDNNDEAKNGFVIRLRQEGVDLQ